MSGQEKHIVGVILAAGLSTRMGSPKALLPLGDSTFLGLSVNALRSAGIAKIICVTGYAHEPVSAAAQEYGAIFVHNSQYAHGMFSSVLTGLSAIAEGSAALVLPVDAPLVHPHSVAALLNAWREENPVETPEHNARAINRRICLPVFASRTGHPPLLGAERVREALQWNGTDGLRGYFASLCVPKRSASAITQLPLCDSPLGQPPFVLVPVPDAGVLSDVDTPAEYAAAQTFFVETEGRTCFTLEEAWALLSHAGLSTRKVRHSAAVALGALRLGLAFKRVGLKINPTLHMCGGLLHDVARQEKGHAQAGYRLLHALGREETALVVGSHTVLPPLLLARLGISLPHVSFGEKNNTNEEKSDNSSVPSQGVQCPETRRYAGISDSVLQACVCVYLADKFFQGDMPVCIAERFGAVKERYQHSEQALHAITQRENVALAVYAWVRERIGEEPLMCVQQDVGHTLERALLRLPLPL